MNRLYYLFEGSSNVNINKETIQSKTVSSNELECFCLCISTVFQLLFKNIGHLVDVVLETKWLANSA